MCERAMRCDDRLELIFLEPFDMAVSAILPLAGAAAFCECAAGALVFCEFAAGVAGALLGVCLLCVAIPAPAGGGV